MFQEKVKASTKVFHVSGDKRCDCHSSLRASSQNEGLSIPTLKCYLCNDAGHALKIVITARMLEALVKCWKRAKR